MKYNFIAPLIDRLQISRLTLCEFKQINFFWVNTGKLICLNSLKIDEKFGDNP